MAGVIRQARDDANLKPARSNTASSSQETSTPKTLAVYVRRDGQARILAFDRIQEISDEEALKGGVAIDGNQFVIGVSADKLARSGEVEETGIPSFVAPRYWTGHSLHQNLAATQLALLDWLQSLGYTVKFG
jgi:hypothetical protein